ncbi:MAG TPA: MFS transporter [Cellulomonas sp.]
MSTSALRVAPPQDPSHTPRSAGPRIALIMVSLILAIVPVQLDALVAATALPTIAGDLGGFGMLAWIATAYLLAMAVGTIVAGRLGDLTGRRTMLLTSLAVFGIGSALSGLAPSMGVLIASRALQGLGAGMTFTNLLAVVADVAPPEKRARYHGIVASIAPVSMLVGPWVGGLITDHLSWRWIFWLNVPLVALSLLGVAALVRLPAPVARGRLDIAGLVLAAVTGSGVVLAVTWGGNQYAWHSWQVLTAAAVAVAALVALIGVERRAEQPVLPLTLFRQRSVVLALVILAIGMGAVLMTATNYLPMFLELVRGRSAADSGLLLLPLLLPGIATGLLVGRWTTTGGRMRTAMIVGTSALTVASALLASMSPTTPGLLTATYQVLAGVGIGMLFQTPMVLIQNSVERAEVGAASGTAGFVRMLGAAVGTGALGSVFSATVQGRLPHGLDAGTLTPSVVAGLPPEAMAAVRDAVAAGSSVLFLVMAGLSALALLAALAVPRHRTVV